MASADPGTGLSYFARPSVRTLVFGAFFALTLPLAVYALRAPAEATRFLPLYGVTVGLTHFLVTGLIYLDARNLRYFASSARNRLVYFAVPIAILVGMDLVGASGIRARNASLDAMLFHFVMAANFLHVSRQSFGVLQLFKRQSGAAFPEALRSFENLFFLALVVVQFETLYTGGRYDPGELGVVPSTAAAGLLFAIVAGMHAAVILAAADRRAAALPFLYFVLQAASGSLAVYATGLYNIALAMHYVEYHVVMMPRIFRAPVDTASRVDRLRSALRASPILFYAGLLAIAWGIWFGQRTALYTDPGSASLPMRALLHGLDGIFLCHFFVEAFVWRFSRPHYRDTLGPLYFAARSADR